MALLPMENDDSIVVDISTYISASSDADFLNQYVDFLVANVTDTTKAYLGSATRSGQWAGTAYARKVGTVIYFTIFTIATIYQGFYVNSSNKGFYKFTASNV
jgi:hypothetical protein